MDPYVGEIRLFAGSYAPENWALCDGRLLAISANAPLYTLLGTIYGGDGRTTFGLPDLRSRVPIGMGTGTGLSSRTLGSMSGSEALTLTTANMPAHTHTLYASSDPATAEDPTNAVPAAVATGTQFLTQSSTVNPSYMASSMVSSTGGNQEHYNIMPSMALTYIIALQGIFPIH